MSLKKLQPGGTLDKALNDELENVIPSYNLRKKDEIKIREYVAKYRDYIASPGNKSVTVDPVTKTYKIVGEDAEQFTGSTDPIKKNLFGNFKADDDLQKINLAVSIVETAKENLAKINQATGTASTADTTVKTPEKLVMNSLDDHLLSKYNSTDSYEWKLRQADTDDKRKEMIYGEGSELISNYRKTLAENPNDFEGADLDKITELEQAIKAKDWNKFNELSFHFKWEPYKYLLSDDDKKVIQAEQDAKIVKTADETFTTAGITNPELRTKLIQSGYNQLADANWRISPGADWFNDSLAKVKAVVVRNPTTNQQMIIKDNQLFNNTINDPNDAHYGWSLTHGNNGAELLSPGKTSINWKTNYQPTTEAGTYVGLTSKILSPWYDGYKVYGDPHNKFNTLRLHNSEDTSEDILLNFKDGQYRDSKGNAVQISPILGTTGRNLKLEAINDKLGALPSFKPNSKYAPKNINDIKGWMRDVEAYNSVDPFTLGKDARNKYKWKIGFLKSVFTNPSFIDIEIDPTTKNQIYELLFKTQDLIADRKATGILIEKAGGVLKLANGGLAAEEYMKKHKLGKYRDLNADTSTGNKSRTMKADTIWGSNPLDVSILAANAASLVPGAVGAGAAGAATLLEGARDLQDGFQGRDLANFGVNLALVGASFIGAGGLRHFVKGTKLLDKVVDAEKVLNLAKTTNKVKAKEVETALKVISDSKKIEGSTFTLKQLQNLATDSPEIKQATGVLTNFLAKANTNKNLINFGWSTEKIAKAVDKTSQVIAGVNAAASLPAATSLVGKVVTGEGRNITTEETTALTNVLFGAKIGSHVLKKGIGKHYGLSNVQTAKAEVKATIKGKNEAIVIDDPEIISSIKTTLGNVTNKKELKQAIVTSYNKGIQDEKLHITAKDINKISVSKEQFKAGSIKAENDIDIDKNWWLQKKGRKWAKKYELEGENIPIESIIPPKVKRTKKAVIKPKPPVVKPPVVKPPVVKPPVVKPPVVDAPKVEIPEVKVPVRRSPEPIQTKISFEIPEVKVPVRRSPEPIQTKISFEIPEVKVPVRRSPEPIQTKISFERQGGILKAQDGTGSIYTNKPKKSWIKDALKNFNTDFLTPDKMDIANTIALSILNKANDKSTKYQIQAQNALNYSTPLLATPTIRINTVYEPKANVIGAETRSSANRVGNSISDLNASINAKLQGEKIISANKMKAQELDQERIDNLRGVQMNTNADIAAKNLGIVEQNKARTADTLKGISLLNANSIQAEATNKTNYIAGLVGNWSRKDSLAGQEALYEAMSDEGYLENIKKRDELTSEGGKKSSDYVAWKTKYDKAVGGTPKSWEESDEYKKWKVKIETIDKFLRDHSEKLNRMTYLVRNGLPYNLAYQKSGGSLSKADRIGIEKEKSESKRKLKEIDLLYKVMAQNNEMLKNALIKVFK